MKIINNFRIDLSDVSAKTATLPVLHPPADVCSSINDCVVCVDVDQSQIHKSGLCRRVAERLAAALPEWCGGDCIAARAI